jgi:hypothetical protein
MRQTDTIRRLQRDDLATQMVLRYHRESTLLDGDIPRNTTLHMLQELSSDSLVREERPTSIAEWIALVLFAADTPTVIALRRVARENADTIYIQAERWLGMIDAQHASRQKHTTASNHTGHSKQGVADDGR